MDMFREVEAEHAAAAEPAADGEPEPAPAAAKPERDEGGKFKKTEPKEKVEGKVTPTEGAKWREKNREKMARLNAREQELANKEKELDRLRAEAERSVTQTARKLVEDGDFEAAAQALGHASWNKLNEHVARHLASPEYRRIRALEQAREEDQKRLNEIERQRTEQEAKQREEQVEAQAMSEIQSALAASSDPVIVGLNRDNHFAVLVYREMDKEHKRTGEVMDLEDAAQAVSARAQESYARLHAVLGGRPTSEAETRKRSPEPGRESPERRTNKHVSRNTATEAAPPRPEKLTDAEWKEIAIKEWGDAVRQEREQERAHGTT